jgi:hypothetical protein
MHDLLDLGGEDPETHRGDCERPPGYDGDQIIGGYDGYDGNQDCLTSCGCRG